MTMALPKIDMGLQDSQLQALEDKVTSFKGLARKTDEPSLKKSARDFESFIFGFMYKQMYNSVQKSDFLGKSQDRDIFMSLYIDEAAKKMEHSPSGIANLILKQYGKNEKTFTNLGSEISGPEILESTNKPAQNFSEQLKTMAKSSDYAQILQDMGRDLATMTDKLSQTVSSPFGMRIHPLDGVEKMHHGVDFALSSGSDVSVPVDGKVVFAGDKGGYGNTVIVDHGAGVTTLYAHLSEVLAKEGDNLKKGSLIGKVGSTGRSTGPHLHFEVRHDGTAVDPQNLVSSLK